MAAQEGDGRSSCDNYTDDAAWEHRHRHRLTGLAAVCRSRNYVTLLILLAVGEIRTDDAPLVPDPYDRTCSKREWERRMQLWRSQVKTIIEQAA